VVGAGRDGVDVEREAVDDGLARQPLTGREEYGGLPERQNKKMK
jgi:hypothetical protein